MGVRNGILPPWNLTDINPHLDQGLENHQCGDGLMKK